MVFLYISLMDKGLIWDILVKYDSDKTKKEFCDSLSSIIQESVTEDSIFSIIKETSNISQSECEVLEKNIGLLYRIF